MIGLPEFIERAKAAGTRDDELVALLEEHGWSRRRTYAALSAYYAQQFGPIPERGGSIENAREAFLFLLAFATLAIWSIALIWLAGALVDRAYPNTADTGYAYGASHFRESVAGQLASVLVAFPIFLWVNVLIARETQRRPESADSGVRKWLTYVALVITAIVLLGDAAWFVTQFLLGDLTVRFVLKALTVAVVAGSILWYYLGSVGAPLAHTGRAKGFAIGSCAGVGLLVILAFLGIGGPAQNHKAALDEVRLTRLQSLSRWIFTYNSAHHALPSSLNDLGPAVTMNAYDPATNKLFLYHPGKGTSYRLCSTFDTSDQDSADRFWQHPAGTKCFNLNAALNYD